ncbi:MAG TPA: SusC/RagA family TonB-linked outer membrane protein [Hanamia sp.]|nr:SusC/RagA family TonB-linked outer membrane protein [Hanamia sp.]
MNKSNPVTVNIKDASIPDALAFCFASQPLSFIIVDKQVIVKDKGKETSAPSLKDTLAIKGKVVNEQNEPVAGATVIVKGTEMAEATDEDGDFAFSVEEHATLIISSIGYDPRKIVINGNAHLIIQMKRSYQALDETVFIAYGNTTRRFNTGSVSKVTSHDIQGQPVSNPLAALQGRVPGLAITTTSGLPGSSIIVQIRGQNSLNPDPNNSLPPNDNPLFIIDGVPFAAQNTNINQLASIVSPGNNVLLNNSYGGISPFNTIDPSEIESIEVLQDADATAIYGSRGANGVILITTKRGKAGKTELTANLFTGLSQVAHTLPMMNTQQYLNMRREAFANDGITPSSVNPSDFRSYAPDLTIYDQSKYTDWKKFFIGHSSYTTNVNTSVSGGSVNNQFFFGVGYFRQTYIYPGDFDYDRASVNFNFHRNSPDKKLSFDFSSIYSVDKNNSSGAPDLLHAYAIDPNFPALLDENGNLVWNYKGASFGVMSDNPLSYLKKKYSLSNFNLLSHLQIGYEILPDLRLRASLGYNKVNSTEYSGNPASSQNPEPPPIASAEFASKDLHDWIIEPQAEYNKRIDKSDINFLLGGTFEEDINSSSIMSGSGYSNDNLITSISGASNIIATDEYSQYRYDAIFGRLNYRYDQRYIIDLNARRDGSSRFGPRKQFGNFGSIGAAWIFLNESFLKKKFKWISFGKLRGSYGTTGNDAIGDYQYLSRWQPTYYYYQGGLGYLPQNVDNPDFSWAVTKKSEGALELGFLSNRLLLTAIFYRNISGNQLVDYQLPSQTGFLNVTENWSAKVENTGWQFVVTSTNIKTKKFSWNISFNLSIPKNRLVSFPGIESSSYATKYVIGRSLSVLNKFRYAGVNDTTGIFQFLTAGGVPTYSPENISNNKYNDIQVVGDLDPKYYGGLSNSFEYKNFQLDIFIEFKKQTGANYLAQIYGANVPGEEFNLPTALLSRWQKPGDKSEFEKLTADPTSFAGRAARTYFAQSSGVYNDASYIRFKNVSFSYEFPKLVKRIKAKTLRLYVKAENLLTITSYQGDDPETQNFYGVPPLRTIAIGFQFIF